MCPDLKEREPVLSGLRLLDGVGPYWTMNGSPVNVPTWKRCAPTRGRPILTRVHGISDSLSLVPERLSQSIRLLPSPLRQNIA